ncbi:MAG: radical SAM protein [Oscillospiraceae bacterium]|jgi:pyruvate formate lyase activating enzyme|nr:radical SAM protein [Oscillospiraceae bacterium]
MPGEAAARLADRTGLVHHMESMGTVDGPGVRFVLFLQGCPLRCLYCHNPDAIGPGGTRWTAGAVTQEILRYRSFLQGVTLSGGEPLAQPDFAEALALLLREADLPCALDTAGAPHLNRCRAAIDAAALLLLDVKAADPALALRLSGADNRRSLATLDYCERTGKAVWLRHVLVPGFTLEADALEALAALVLPYRCIARVELLPFHQLGAPKWDQAGLPYRLRDVPAVTQEETAWAKEFFARRGICAV